MPVRFLLPAAGLIVLLASSALLKINLAPVEYTGAPEENTCGSCHSGQINTGPGTVSLEAPAAYVSEQVYPLTFTIEDSLVPVGRFGFSSTVLDTQDLLAGSSQLVDIVHTSLQVSLPGGQARQYVGHAQADTTRSWSWNWTAPVAGTGPVTVYVAAVVANRNAQPTGDRVYTRTFVIPEASTFPQAQFEVDTLAACVGSSLHFTDASTGLIDTYAWDFGPAAHPATASQAGPHAVTFDSAGTFPVRLIVGSGEGSDTITQLVTIHPLPQLGSNQDTLRVCERDEATPLTALAVQVSGGLLPYTYDWSCDASGRCGLSTPAAAAPAPQPLWLPGADTLHYAVAVTDARGCQATQAGWVAIQTPAPVPEVIWVGDSLFSSAIGTLYSWALFDPQDSSLIFLPTETEPTFFPGNLAPGHSGWVVLMIHYANGCARLSEPVSIPGGATALEGPGWVGLRVYPQPAAGQFWISWDMRPEAAWSCRLLSLSGQEIWRSGRIQQTGLRVETPALPGGLYLLEIRSGGQKAYRKVLLH
ncbi:MAG: hypothetical protein D6722_28260 [Bacteroidetes bacterium]|nr:MAG: hypothetical protein D6722_28260 [Bacteroidota bacterium]